MEHARCTPDSLSTECLDSHALKHAAAIAALVDVRQGSVIGVGSGSTVHAFIEELAERGPLVAGAVPASEISAQALKDRGVQVVSLNEMESLDFYFDGADEIDSQLRLMKGRGAAMTREKVLAEAARVFVCMADASKMVDGLGKAPLPVEVLPMARVHVQFRLTELGATAFTVRGELTDNGNEIIDARGFDLSSPEDLEAAIQGIAGVVGCGLFARRRADVAYVAGPNRVLQLRPS